MIIGIVGLGLIGGSLAIDLRSQGHQILGVSRREQTCQQAIERGIVDDASVNLTLLAATDVIFICTPIGLITSTVEQLIPHLPAKTILTDVGSVKAPVVDAVAPLWHNFVGGHPMAGTAESGLDAAIPNLFVDRRWCLTSTDTTPPEAVQTVAKIVRSVQAQIYFCRPEEHDRAVAWISHLPVMVSGGLIAACMSEDDATVLELAKNLASSGFRDTSRVGGGNPELGLMMAQYNRDALLRSLYAYRQQLEQVISEIAAEDWRALEQKLQANQSSRPQFFSCS